MAVTEARRTDDPVAALGPNERAILDRIPWEPARRLAARVVRLKMRLQFTGWLQYLLPLPLAALLLLAAAVTLLLDAPWPAAVLAVLAGLLLLVAAMDIVTTRWGVRPHESRPARNDHLDPFEMFRARRSCRSFQTRHMTDDDKREVLDAVAASLAVPTLGHRPVRLEYVAAPVTVWPTVNASEFLVAIVPKEYDRTAIIDVGRILQRVVMHATRMGLGTCWIGPGADQASVTAHLGDRFDPEADHVVCVCAVGYRSRFVPLFIRLFNRAMGDRLPLEQLCFSDMALEHPIDVQARPYRQFDRVLEACQWSPSSYNGQTTRAVLSVRDGQVAAVHFLAITTSRYYAPIAVGIWCANWELGCAALGIAGTFTTPATDHLAPTPPSHDVTWVPQRA
jgi:nitroreductase